MGKGKSRRRRPVPPGLMTAWRLDRCRVRARTGAQSAPDFEAMAAALDTGWQSEDERCRLLAELARPGGDRQGRLF